ncbi:MAG: hypothetical protein KDJ16_17650, partial [Hyphomicrobiales bacterium]|nr:hypothetical protein [Hyphomicrobiales bacterium]
FFGLALRSRLLRMSGFQAPNSDKSPNGAIIIQFTSVARRRATLVAAATDYSEPPRIFKPRRLPAELANTAVFAGNRRQQFPHPASCRHLSL